VEAMDGYCTYRDYLDRPRARDFVADVAPVTVSCNNNNNKNGIQTLFRQQLQMERGGEPDLQGREPIFPTTTTTRRRSTGRRWHWKSASSYPSCCPAASFLQRGRKPDAAAGARGKEARLLATSWSRRQGVGRTWQPLLLPSGQDRTRNAPEPEKNGGWLASCFVWRRVWAQSRRAEAGWAHTSQPVVSLRSVICCLSPGPAQHRRQHQL
jgi:hypothetical protein